jgi:hypothetical protein
MERPHDFNKILAKSRQFPVEESLSWADGNGPSPMLRSRGLYRWS